MQYEDWKYHPSRLPDGKREKEDFLGKLEQEFLQQVQQNPKVADFLSPYNTASHEHFLKSYSMWKRLMITSSDYRMKEIETGRELRYRTETEGVFDAILKKKLFNTEVFWRANQISLPGINITWDFNYWRRRVRNCPFIEPVNAQEIEVMQRFLKSDHCELDKLSELRYGYSYDEVMEKGNDGEVDGMPEWFEFYDTYMGTGHLLLLPDIRGEREEYYRELYFDRKRQLDLEAGKQPYVYVEGPPGINSFSKAEYHKLAQLIEDDIFKQLFEHEMLEDAAKTQAEEAAGVYDIEDIVWQLENIADLPPVRGGISWREALYQCWQDHLKANIHEDLPLLWEEYKFLRETGFGNSAEDEEQKHDRDLSTMVMDQILEGRELAGESRDLNF